MLQLNSFLIVELFLAPIIKWVLIICLLDSIICLLGLFVLTRILTMLTRYAKLAYKFYFTSTVDFLIYFYACIFKRIYGFELHIFYYKNYIVE